MHSELTTLELDEDAESFGDRWKTLHKRVFGNFGLVFYDVPVDDPVVGDLLSNVTFRNLTRSPQNGPEHPQNPPPEYSEKVGFNRPKCRKF